MMGDRNGRCYACKIFLLRTDRMLWPIVDECMVAVVVVAVPVVRFVLALFILQCPRSPYLIPILEGSPHIVAEA